MQVTIGESLAKKENPTKAMEALFRPRCYENFIDSYLTYTSNQESTRKIHKWVAISIIAAALERKVYFDSAYFTVFPNLYTFIIGESGVVRKSTSTNIGVDLLRSLDDFNIMSERLTASSLIGQMERAKAEFVIGDATQKQSSVFCYASELVVFMESVYGSISELLTTFYDCTPHDSNKPWVYETKGEGQVKVYGPCLNILGASTPTWLKRAIPIEEMEGGFSSRVIFVVEKENPDLFVAWPEINDELKAMKPKLLLDLQQIHTLRGKFQKTPEAHKFFEDWYINYKTHVIRQTDGRFKGYFGRKPTTVVKLAMILAVAESNDLVFDQKHMEAALALLDELEASMFDAFGSSGKNPLADGTAKILELIQVQKTMNHKEIMRLFWRDINGNDLNTILTDLSKMELIKIRTERNAVHYDWIQK